MANPEDTMQREGRAPDGRPRRQPPIIEAKAVEVSRDAPNDSGSGSVLSSLTRLLKRILASLPVAKVAVIGSACVVVGIVAGALWIYLASDGDGPPRNAITHDAAAPDDVMERLAKLETALKSLPAQTPPGGELANRVAAVDAMVTPLAGRIAELERGVRDIATAARSAGEQADKAAGLLEAAKRSGDEQTSLQQQERSTLEDVAVRLRALESMQTVLRQQQEELERAARAAAPDRSVRIAIIAAAMASAVERGSPFTVEFAAAKTLGVAEPALASLEPFAATGVPTQSELFHDLSALLPELLQASAPAGRDLGYLERLQASAVKMMNIRPVQNTPGDDPATVIGRIEFKMARQDMAGIIIELDKLPAPAKERAQTWRTKVLAWQGAVEAAQSIASASLARLGESTLRGPVPR